MAQIELGRGLLEGGKSYPFRVINVDEKFGPSGFPYLILNMRCLDEDSKGLPLRTNLSLSPNARFRVDQFLDSIGAPLKGKVDSASFIGSTPWAEVELGQDQNGNPRNEVVRWLLPPEGWVAPEPDEDEMGMEMVAAGSANGAAELSEAEKDIAF